VRPLVLALCAAAGCAWLPAQDAAPASGPPAAAALRIYHIGNSLTFGVASCPHFAEVLGRDRQLTDGMHVLWGAPLSAIWDKRDQPSVATPAFGPYPQALGSRTWDVLTLQPSFATLEGATGDLAMATRFIALARANSPGIRIYIYEAWPTIGAHAAVGVFAQKWSRSYRAGAWDGALYSHDYCRTLVERLRAADAPAATPVLLLPVGSVLAALEDQARAGSLPGVPSIESLYRDGTHLGAIGNYIALITWYAVLRQESPLGLPGPAVVPEVSDGLARAVQQAAWRVVQADPLCGLAASGVPASAPARGAPPR
jgi:hypothetical protein